MRRILPAMGLLLALGAPALAQVARVSHTEADMMLDAHTVVLTSVNVPGDALVIVRAVRRGRIDPAPLGQTRLGPGETANVRVQLAREARPDESLTVMLHADFGRKGVYDRDPVVLTVNVPQAVLRGAATPRRAAAQ